MVRAGEEKERFVHNKKSNERNALIAYQLIIMNDYEQRDSPPRK
ncbi:hypothetical protein STZ1_10253 [Bacillus subtilis]